MNVSKRLRSLLTCQRANVMVVAAACMPIIVGAAAIGVDTISMTVAKRQLQRSADSAAIAGAYALVQSKSATTAVDRDLAINNKITLSATRTVDNPTSWGTVTNDARAVRVALTTNRSTPFWGLFNHSTTPISVEAKAAYVYLGEFCMVSLTTDTSTGVTFQGNTTMNLGCGVESNSKGTTAVSAGGSASVTASPIAAVGGVPSSSSYASGTTLLPYSPPLADPFAYVTRTPTPPSDCVSLDLNPNGNGSISWKTNQLGSSRSYCIVGSTTGQNAAKIQSNVTFPDDVTVYIQGGTLDIGPATVTGTHVNFVLTTPPGSTTGVASMSMNANAVLNLTARESGSFAGILFYQDPRVTSGTTTQINGNSGATLQGAFYFPNGDLSFNGNSGMTITCLQLVALHLSFSGSSTITNSCPSTGSTGAKSFAGYFVKLVA